MIPNKTPEELKQIAIDFHHGLIFSDRHLPEHERITTPFMILRLMTKEEIKALKEDDPGMIYEYLSVAGPHSINGMPMFLSLRMLSQHDTKIVMGTVIKLRKAEESVSVTEQQSQ